MSMSSIRLFISYARIDEVRIAEIVAVLRAGGFDPWWDDRLEPGDDWKESLRSRIASCDALVCMMSPDFIDSEWCQWELAEASALSKPIIPILLRAETALPPALARLHYVNASRGLQNLDVARLVGKLARLKQTYLLDMVGEEKTPGGFPARFRTENYGRSQVYSTTYHDMSLK
jgi:hypothetical protein